MIKYILVMLLAIAMSLITSYVRTHYEIQIGDILFDILPFVSGWWCCAIIEGMK